MSEQTSNELAIAGSAAVPVAANSDLDMQNPDLEEKSASTRVDSMLGNLDLLRQIILVLSVAICVALIVLVVAWLKEPEMRPLGNFSTEELIPILDHFDQKQIEYQLEGNTIRVPADKYGALKLELTRAGLNNPTAEGDDILLQDMGFGVSQRLEQERLKLSRERQLARAIEQIRQVRKAQVLLAMPKQSVF
ncbi:MAG: flagellar basal body M-ring protein FliF, partial [Photobacterium halotolerans]